MVNINIVLVCILYNKNIEDSLTINSLLKCKSKNYSLMIVNNGPSFLEDINFYTQHFSCRNIDVFVEEYIDNKPLSKIYNDIVKIDSNYDGFVLLDDDSEITNSYLDSVLDNLNCYDVILPKIISKVTNNEFYPVFKGNIPEYGCFLKNTKEFFSVGSGLAINKKALLKFEIFDYKIFDERFALYGVDFSFFRRMIILKKNGVFFDLLIAGSILHSLSREDKEKSNARHVEGLIDKILTIKFYSRSIIHKIYNINKLMIIEIKEKKAKNIKAIFKVYKNGKHPRC